MAVCFSLITPVLNGEKYIARSYWCLRNQECDDWEWIIVDDGSTDQTVREVEQLRDPRIKLIRNEKNCGRGLARTVALNKSSGSWVVVWDIDDLYFPDRLTQALAAKEQGKDFCVSGCVIIDKEFNVTGGRGFGLFDDKRTRMFLHPTLSCSAALLKEIGYKSSFTIGEDFLPIFKISRDSQGVWSSDPVIAYREDSNPNKLTEAILAKENQIKDWEQISLEEDFFDAAKPVIRRVRWKKFLLSIFLVCPSLYKWTFTLRSQHASMAVGNLTESKQLFLKEAKRRLAVNDWACA